MEEHETLLTCSLATGFGVSVHSKVSFSSFVSKVFDACNASYVAFITRK